MNAASPSFAIWPTIYNGERRGAADVDGLSLRLSDLVQGGVGCQTRHPERAKEDAQILEAVRIVDFARMRPSCSSLQDGVLPNGGEGDDEIAFCVLRRRVGFEHLEATAAFIDRGCSAGTFGSFVGFYTRVCASCPRR